MSHFYTPWKRQKTIGFLTFSGDIETWHWTKLGNLLLLNHLFSLLWYSLWKTKYHLSKTGRLLYGNIICEWYFLSIVGFYFIFEVTEPKINKSIYFINFRTNTAFSITQTFRGLLRPLILFQYSHVRRTEIPI